MANGYGNDPVKEKAREEIYKFANKHLPKDRSKGTAVYLASDNDRESYWLDKLGIPRSNRIILESDRDKINSVRKMNKDVAVLPFTTTELFNEKLLISRWKPFWYCGLDYECMLNRSIRTDLNSIAENNLILDGGILYTNVVANQEQTHQKLSYLSSYLLNIPKKYHDGILSDPNLSIKDIINQIPEKDWFGVFGDFDTSSKNLRNIYYLRLYYHQLSYFILPFVNEKYSWFIKSVGIHEDIKKDLIMEKDFGQPFIFVDFCTPSIEEFFEDTKELWSDKMINYIREVTKKREIARSEKNILQAMPLKQILKISSIVNNAYYEKDFSEGSETFFFQAKRYTYNYYHNGGMLALAKLIEHRNSEGYIPTDVKSFGYVSSKNTQMMLDILRINQIQPRCKDKVNKLLSNSISIWHGPNCPYLASPNAIKNLKKGETKKSRLEKGSSVYTESLFNQFEFLGYDYTWEPIIRSDLGSSFKPPLNRALAKKCVLEGMSDEEIEDRYQLGKRGRKIIGGFRSALSRGFLEKQQQEIQKNNGNTKQKNPATTLPKNLLPSKFYRTLPEELQLRMQFFEEEVLNREDITGQRVHWIRKAFAESNLDDLVTPETNPIRFYAFFDDVSRAAINGETINADYLNKLYKDIMNTSTLTPIVLHEPKKTEYKIKKQELPENIKEEILEFLEAEIDKDELWENYNQYFKSRQQFGAFIRWNSKRKNND